MFLKFIYFTTFYKFATLFVWSFIQPSDVLCNNSTSGQNCQYQVNVSHVLQQYELLNDCEKVQIDFELEKLERETRINESDYACDQRGISGTVFIVKNESAARIANNIFLALSRSNMYNRLCQKFFVFGYSADHQEFKWVIGNHSLITENEMEAIVKSQNFLDHVALSISNMISNFRITAIEKRAKGKSEHHCQYQTNESSIIDPYGLLSDCEKMKIVNELTELRLQTRTNISSNTCMREGLSGTVIVLKNENALHAVEAFYKELDRNHHVNCISIFVFAYSYETGHFGLKFGADSLLNGYDGKVILANQAKNADGSRLIDFISGLITNVQIGALKKLDTINDPDLYTLAKLLFIIALVVGFLGNVLCIAAILFTKLIQAYNGDWIPLEKMWNISSNTCMREGLSGTVIVLKNENALHAVEAFYKELDRNHHVNCISIFVFAYSYETGHFGLKFGADSLLNGYDGKVILANQAKNADGSRLIDFISGLITNVQIGALKKLDTINDPDLYTLAKLLFIIALVVGFLGNVLCIAAILFTKLIQNPFHKYLLVLLTSDTLFILCISLLPHVENRHFLTCALLSVLFTSTICAGSNILVLLTMERFFAIVFPLWHMQYSHINRWIIILLGLLPMQLYSIYFRLMRPYFDPENFTIFENGRCYRDGIFIFKLSTIPFHIFIFVIPLLVVIFVNVTIMIKLRQHRNSKTSSNNSNDGNSETLWILPLIYTALSTPRFIMSIVKQFFYPTSPTFLMDGIESVADILFLMDFVYHWFFYAISSSFFRKTFISFWSGICRKSRGAKKINSRNTRDNSVPLKLERKWIEYIKNLYTTSEHTSTTESTVIEDRTETDIDTAL